MGKRFTDEDDDLLAKLGVVVEPEKVPSRTPREERIIAGFEEIQRFVKAHGHAPRHGEDGDIFERLYAVRLDRIREQDDCRVLLSPFDHQDLLSHSPEAASPSLDDMDDNALLAELGVQADAPDIGELRHVRSSSEKRAAEEIATRSKCEDFETFRPLFEEVQKELDAGLRETRPLGIQTDIEPGRFFIVSGQKAYVAEMGEEFTQRYGDRDARLRVIFDNGTESNMLRRSLQRALHKDEKGRRILETSAGLLFADVTADGDESSGTIYVLRSKADIPFVAENRDLVHKIGVTTAKVETAYRRRTARSDVPDGRGRNRRHLQSLQHQPRQAGEADPPCLRPGAPRHRDRRPLRQSRRAARVVLGASRRHRRCGREDPGRNHHPVPIRREFGVASCEAVMAVPYANRISLPMPVRDAREWPGPTAQRV